MDIYTRHLLVINRLWLRNNTLLIGSEENLANSREYDQWPNVPWVQQLNMWTTLTAVKCWPDQTFLFPPVWACMAQCKASREMRQVGIASRPTVSQLCWDRLHFCLALTSRAVCVLPTSLWRRGGKGTTRWACLVSASDRSGLLSGQGS